MKTEKLNVQQDQGIYELSREEQMKIMGGECMAEIAVTPVGIVIATP